MVEAVLAGLERSPLPPAHQIEGILAAHHARRFQLPAHPQRGRARRQIDKGLRFRPEGRKNQPSRHARRQQEQEQEKRPQDARGAGTLSSSRLSAAHHALLSTLL
jgi:hypothetical protein